VVGDGAHHGRRIEGREAVLPEGPGLSMAKLVDLEMLVMGTGRQRTEAEYRQLFRRVGLELIGIGPTNPMCSVVVAVARQE
jgi:O-methyltransferase domain